MAKVTIMGSSFIEYRGYGFWSHDSFIEDLAEDAVKAILSRPKREDWLAELAKHWELQATGAFGGWAHLLLDEFLISEDRRIEVREVIRGVAADHAVDDPIHQTGILLLQLLDGQLRWNSASPPDYMVQLPHKLPTRKFDLKTHSSPIHPERSPMKVLVIGGGGREHAIIWALHKSPRVTEVVCAPGNAGIARLARCIPVDLGNLDAMTGLVASERPALTVIGPELPLSLGLTDELMQRGFRVFGPTKAAAQLETSKAFAKEFMQRHGIPTAAHAVCTTLDKVREELRRFSVPIVVKADGLAAGKGVVICQTHLQAERAAAEMFSGALLGVAETEIVLEEFLEGEELSFFALCDGKHAVALASAQDHKRVGDGDTGPNTGGMGAYTGDGLVSGPMEQWLLDNIAQVVVDEMRLEGAPFHGILFCGMMMVPQPGGTVQPMVLEFNTRFGDPETQAILIRLETDIVELFDAAIDGTADSLDIRMKPGASACVIAASAGYPGKYPTGLPISGLEAVEDALIFHSGTAIRDGAIATAGGRILGVTAVSPAGLQPALDKTYAALANISFDGMHYRRDIGWRALRDGL